MRVFRLFLRSALPVSFDPATDSLSCFSYN